MKHLIIVFSLFILTISYIYEEYSIKVQSGWNIIGAKSTITVSELISEPQGIITSFYFGYTPLGYTAADTLYEGTGYWVKTTGAGVLKWGIPPVTSCANTPTVSYGGKTYTTVAIGYQCWMAENLDIGTMMQGTDTATNNGVIEKYCYNNNVSNCETYGGFYQWNEAMQYSTTSGAQGICPTGWHIPTNTELLTLRDSVLGDGNALKAVGQGTEGGSGTNTSGFTALLSGFRAGSGSFDAVGGGAVYWSSWKGGAISAYSLTLNSNNSDIKFFYHGRENGFSVRCLMN